MTPLHDVAPTIRQALGGVAILGTCALLGACGSTVAPSGSTTGARATAATSAGSNSASVHSASSAAGGSTSGGTAAAAKVSLDVTIAASPSSPPAHYTLSCEPAGGTTPDPAAACAKLLTGQSIFAGRQLHVMCPMILEGGARATVTGIYFGTKVHVTIVNGGCDLSRWAKLKSIFG